MDLNKVLSTGADFHTTGAGNIHHQLSQLTLAGKDQNLRRYKEVIAGALGTNALKIRRSNFGYQTQREVIGKIKEEVKKQGQSMTLSEVRNLKEIVKHYGTAGAIHHEAAEISEAQGGGVKSEATSIEEGLEAKMAARQAVKAGVRPNQPMAKINRVLANEASPENQSFSPYDRASHQEEVKRVVAIGQVRRPGVAAPDDPRSQRDSHGTGLATGDSHITGLATGDSHGTGLSSNRRLGMGLKDSTGSKNSNLPPTRPPRISLAA